MLLTRCLSLQWARDWFAGEFTESPAAAHAYLSRHGVDGEVTASEQRVTVRTTVVVQLPLLALLGVGEHRVTAERSAEPVSEP